MFLNFPQLQEDPFRIAPDPHFLYLSEGHARAQSYIRSAGFLLDGFVVITGEIGSGKSILISDFLLNAGPDVIVAEIHQTRITPFQFLQIFLAELGFKPFNKNKAELLSTLNRFLLRNSIAGKRTVLVIDEAQDLSIPVLEEIRMLTGIETGNKRILSVILAGQPEFRQTLDSPDLRQLAQRSPLHFKLRHLDRDETEQYVRHRLKVAGDSDCSILAPGAFDLIYRHTDGVPRLINSLCGTALVCAFADNLAVVSIDTLNTALDELQWREVASTAEKKSPDVTYEAMPDQQPGNGKAKEPEDWAELARQFDVQSQIIIRLRRDMSEKITEVQALRGEIDELRQSGRLGDEQDDARTELDSEINVLCEAINQLKSQQRAAVENRNRLIQQCDEVNARNAKLMDELATRKSQIENYERVIEEMRTENEHAAEERIIVSANGRLANGSSGENEERLLVSLDGDDSAGLPIRSGRMSLGSGADNDIRIRSEFISPHHAEIVSGGSDSVLADLDSTNGTFVNNRRIRRHALRDGDSITIGNHRFKFIRRRIHAAGYERDRDVRSAATHGPGNRSLSAASTVRTAVEKS